MRPLSYIGIIGLVLVLAGALNWGLVGLFDYNLVAEIVGTGAAADVVYVLVGVGGLLALAAFGLAVGKASSRGAGSTVALVGAVALVPAIVGALNWGLVGLFEYNLVAEIFGTGTATDTVYVLIGAAGLLSLLSIGSLSGRAVTAEEARHARHPDVGERDRDDYRRAA
ncbi:MAG TPA: DUF378 domain-containing protein [Thermoleophilia bacterium]|nr:DUF378 domain-containing protein [Thermoleophilia bacterium]